jgi:hypothetical protein
MNIIVALHNYKNNVNELCNLINPIHTVVSTEDDKSAAFRSMALEIDKIIYIDRVKVDFVLYAMDTNVRWPAFLDASKHITIDSDTIYLTQNYNSMYRGIEEITDGNFYCRPHVFSMLGNVYKIELDSGFKNKNVAAMLYAVNRSNYDIVSIP